MENKIGVKIRGTCSLLMNRFSEDESSGRGKKQYNDDEECEKRVYRDEEGVYMPARWIKNMLVNSSKDFKLRGRKTYRDVFKGGVILDEEFVRGLQDYKIHKEPVCVQRARIMRVRPVFAKGWEVCFNLTIIDEQIQPELLKEVLVAGGKYNGLGDKRPEHGRFEIVDFKILQ